MSDQGGMQCPIRCGLCCTDAGHTCVRLTSTGCSLPREQRPPGCNRYLCGIALAVLDGVLTFDYGLFLKEYEKNMERHRTAVGVVGDAGGEGR